MRCSPKEGENKPATPTLQPTCDKCGKDLVHYRVEMENLGLAALVEVEARIRLIRKGQTLGTRKPLSSDLEKLLELNGKWREARRNEEDVKNHTGDRFFHYVLPCEVVPAELGDDDYYLFQVWSKHGFTNFGRVHKLRLRRNPHLAVPFDGFLVDDPDARRRRRAVVAGLATLIARVTP